MKKFTIKYGTRFEPYYKSQTIEVVCEEKDIDTIAYAIYLGYVQSDFGWCEITTPTNEKYSIVDCM